MLTWSQRSVCLLWSPRFVIDYLSVSAYLYISNSNFKPWIYRARYAYHPLITILILYYNTFLKALAKYVVLYRWSKVKILWYEAKERLTRKRKYRVHTDRRSDGIGTERRTRLAIPSDGATERWDQTASRGDSAQRDDGSHVLRYKKQRYKIPQYPWRIWGTS
jgi:hypothetical protein